MHLDLMDAKAPVVEEIRAAKEVAWENPGVCPFDEIKGKLPLAASDIADAEARLARFAPFIAKKFPETAPLHGIIESPLTDIRRMKDFLNESCGADITGRLLLKQDSHLAVSGSVKARGGIYEVLKHTEDLALAGGLLGEDYTVFDSEESGSALSFAAPGPLAITARADAIASRNAVSSSPRLFSCSFRCSSSCTA